MSYRLSLSPLAEQQLRRHADPLRAFIIESLHQLAASPAAVSHPSTMVTRGQLADFRFEREPVTVVWVTVAFLYGSDEQTLHIEHIAVEFGE